MSVRIEALGGGELTLSGDLEMRVTLPPSAVDGRFSIAFSDGTLVSAHLHDDGSRYTFKVQVEGAGIMRIERQNGREALVLDWRMEWMVVGHDAQICAANADPMQADQLVLGFESDLKRAA